MIMIAEPAQDKLAFYRKLAEDRYKAMTESLVLLRDGNAGLKADGDTYQCTGELKVSGALIHSTVKVTEMQFEDGSFLRYDGSGWGLGLGVSDGGIGSGWFNVPPSDLLRRNKCKFQVFFATVGGGATEISFWNESGSTYLGVFVAGSLGLGLGSFGGDGKFYPG
jgi:hypothetical protein